MKSSRGHFIALALCLLCFARGAVQLDAATRPLIMGTRGAVVSGHHQASDAGLTMLKNGGNAIDAGVATVFAQAVVEFDRFGIGGEAPVLIYLADEKKVVSLSGQGTAPQAATIEWFRSRDIDLVPMDGFLPATVPSVVDTLILALDEYGTMTLGEVLAPAIDLAERGFAVHPEFKMHIEEQEQRFRSEWTTSAKIFLPDGKVPEIGDLFVQADLARTLKRLVEAEAAHKEAGRSAGLKAARDLFYAGEMAEEIVGFQKGLESRDANGFKSAGLLEVEDLAGFHSRIE